MTDDIRDERLSRLYRETDDAAPPEALDRAILEAARAGVAPVRRRAGWRSWTLPLSVAATLVLSVTLTLVVQQEQAPREPEAAPVADEPRAPVAAPEEKMKAAADLAVQPAAPRAARQETAQEAAREAVKREAERPAVAPALAPAPVAPLRKESVGAAPPRAPEPWLDEIRRLKQQGKDKEAAEALAAFRKAYPDYRLPDDLR